MLCVCVTVSAAASSRKARFPILWQCLHFEFQDLVKVFFTIYMCLLMPILGMRFEKHSRLSTVFQIFSTIQRKTMAKQFFQSALRLNDSYNHAHTPGQHKWPSPGQEPDYKCSKKVEVWRSCLMFRQKGTWIVIFSNLELTFYVQDCHSQTAKVEYQG